MNHKGFYRALRNLVYLTQLGLNLIVPMLLCVWGSTWLKNQFALGNWVVLVGILVGLLASVTNVIRFYRMAMSQAQNRSEDQE